jgi:glycosyltransferase involved in cell wall biosynthesis
VGAREIAALQPEDGPGPHPIEVRHRIRRDVLEDYLRVARTLDESRVEVVSIQHEFGIWGGDDSAYALDFIDALATPAAVTLHQVPRRPTPAQRKVLVGLVEAARATIVMSDGAASLLATICPVDASRLDVVPHGIPDLPLVDPAAIKPRLGLEGRSVILSFGLLAPAKGYEAVIAAMPAIVRADPSACYVILGVTEPDQLRLNGEAYRHALEAQAAGLGVAAQVRFVDEFVGRVQLGLWLEAADVFVTPYRDLDQAVSGALAYAMGAGKAIVSTPFAHASELLADGRGRLVPAGSTEAIADAIIGLLGDPELRATLGRQSYDHSREMVWWKVGAAYRRIFARVAGRPGGPLPPMSDGSPPRSGRAAVQHEGRR